MVDHLRIPDTDLKVSRIGLGTVNAGLHWNVKQRDEILSTYLDLGGNLLDTARVYSDWVPGAIGRSETALGSWLKKPANRQRVVLMTKGGHPHMDSMHTPRMSAQEMQQDLELSLTALQTDVIDLYFYHRDDLNQSVEAEIEVMESFRKAGKIRYYGCSNWDETRIAKAAQYCHDHHYRGFVADQALLNLGVAHMRALGDDTMRAITGGLNTYHQQHPELLAMPYTGIAGGYFHHYLMRGPQSVVDSDYDTPTNHRLAQRVGELTEQYHASISQVVLGFFSVQPFACVPLFSPHTPAQLSEVMQGLALDFQPADFEL